MRKKLTCQLCGSLLLKRQLSSTLPRNAKRALLNPLASSSRTFRVGIVGAGPSGFYAAARLLQMGSKKIRVDMFEELPTPFGLVRYGVAPDHPEVKNCEHKFETTASDPRFTYYGNVQIGGPMRSSKAPFKPPGENASLAASVSVSDLRPHYDALLFTYGASQDRSLGIPGETDLSNILSARTFVHFYNGHPYSHMPSSFDLSRTEKVTIIGQGNVALDCARILLAPIDQLKHTDIPEHALAHLSKSSVKQVEIVGRRGALQFAGTTKELREMMQLPDVHFNSDTALLEQAERTLADYPQMNNARMKKRLMALMKDGSVADGLASKTWSLQYLRSPVAFYSNLSKDNTDNQVKSVEWSRTRLIEDGSDPVDWNAELTAEKTVSETDLVLKSIGYRSIPIEGLPFNARRGIVYNTNGRVEDSKGEQISGLYVCGWLARGPTGVLTTTMMDAHLTAEIIIEDLAKDIAPEDKPPLDISALTDFHQIVSWKNWQTIDKEERFRGAKLGKEREKIVSVKEMLALVQ